ncbi:hypothetical protein MtrunA17_Chr6g0457521 [Medicago truncatula]|uniref:Transmembrane protein n=1 Tax=Medicago truncatula TaxID=3880 RepID=A0A396HAW9_MEDTR|nr:hypothetical protein MtrunA17_Chr6g0457521 [Medicago truncatula]
MVSAYSFCFFAYNVCFCLQLLLLLIVLYLLIILLIVSASAFAYGFCILILLLASMEVDWSKLPTELLNLISQRIYHEVDLIRFRSVCSTRRSSSIPNHHQILPFKFSLLKLPVLTDPNGIDTINNNTSFWYLSKQNIFIIKTRVAKPNTFTHSPNIGNLIAVLCWITTNYMFSI